MDHKKPLWAVGLMSGTSLDGIDAALIRTDGETVHEVGPWLTLPFDTHFTEDLKMATQQIGDIALVERDFTVKSVEAVQALLEKADMRADDIDVIGFHGQTIDHRPYAGITWQIGNGAMLAAKTGINVVTDFRRRDIAEGGQGAPLVPLYHAALASELEKPLVVLNLGGIANVTWIGNEDHDVPWIMAFDTGPGNVLMNSYMQQRFAKAFDDSGELAGRGTVDAAVLEGYLYDSYFSERPPKSLDRLDFGLEAVMNLTPEDALATLLELTAQGVAKATEFFPHPPKRWLAAGGGVHNAALMARLGELVGQIDPVEAVGWNADSLEAQAFGFLAVRSLRNLPLTLPPLTGAHQPTGGGAFYRA